MLKRTKDHDEINSILKHDYIWPRIAGEGIDRDSFTADINDCDHHLFTEGCLFQLCRTPSGVVIHANVLPEFRHKAEEAAREALVYGFTEMGADKIHAVIPTKYGSVYGFALKFMQHKRTIDGNHHLEAIPQ